MRKRKKEKKRKKESKKERIVGIERKKRERKNY